MKDRDDHEQRPGSEEYVEDGVREYPTGGADPENWDPEDDGVLPLHTGEVEILDEEFIEESLDLDGDDGQYGEADEETAVLPAEDVQGGDQAGYDEEYGEDDALFEDDQFAFEDGAAPAMEEGYQTPVPGFEGETGDFYANAEEQDEVSLVDELADELADEFAEDAVGEEYSDEYAEEFSEEFSEEELVDVGDEAIEEVEEFQQLYEAPGEETWRTRQAMFKDEAQNLALARKWTALADLSRQALDEATWARKGDNRTTLLLDLARLYRDRLSEVGKAGEVFALLADADPTHSEALVFLAEQYRETDNWRQLYRLYLGAVAPTWDPNERLERTREAAQIAMGKLQQPDLAIDAWEQLWNLKDARAEAERELLHLYRSGAHWQRLAGFLISKTEGQTGGHYRLSLREVAEVFLSGVGDEERALEMLKQILEQRPGDPVTLLTMAAVYSQKGDWEALSGLSDQTLEGVSADVNLEFIRLIAAAFWKAGEYDSAHDLYRKVLAEDPDDGGAVKAVEEYLSQMDRHEDLLEFLESRVGRARGEEEQLELLSRMALLAQTNLGSPTKASELWERCVALRPEQAEYHEALASLYDSMADLAGVARALEGQLATRRDPTGRIELLRMLGEHYSDRMGDDNSAERCWHEVLALSPEDYGARQQLLSISRRRGDFEGLNTALEREMALTRDAEWRLELARQSAQNLDENFDDKVRSIAAWQRVLDLSPTDGEALAALEKHHQDAGARAELVFTLSRQVDAAEEAADRVTLVHRMSQLMHEDGLKRASASAAEWVLRLDPLDDAALKSLRSRYEEGEQVGKYLGALEHGTVCSEELSVRAALFQEAAQRSAQDARSGRFFWLRRILGLRGGEAEVLQALRDTADASHQWAALSDLYGRLAVTAEDPDDRRGFRRELARILENEVGEKGRAFVELQSLMLNADVDPGIVEELGRLAGETGRNEDYYAVLGALALAANEPVLRSETLRMRARLCDQGLEAPARAFEEYRAVLVIDPADEAALAELVRLAEAAGLWQQLDEVYAELFDQARDEARLALVRKRIELHRDKLEDPAGAFDLQLLLFRLAPG
ncbi:MAG: hypothetical protein ABI333_08105, partial [bacterium]